ncbi:MAG TPA: serine hydroxymethyltransferase [Phycisphaerae bacterium]|nr:serine hydroxymethyltransferase [Phycisphaerae bacterium]HPS53225.1 serine hydroxymethyltransferase [Phycisphaerae bacterium]
MDRLAQEDPEIKALIEKEHDRQRNTIELIASENHVSIPVLQALGSVLTDKYAEGYPEKRWYCGCEAVDEVEALAITRAKKLFNAEHANVQPHSGTNANLAVYLAAINPGDKIMGMNLAHGGHLSHGLPINLSGKMYKTVFYGVESDSERLDMDKIRQQAKTEKPAIIVAGASAYPRQIDFAAFGEIAREVGCLLMCDVAHIAGLVVTGQHPHPFPHADFITTTNHKTLRGPRGGLILCRQQWAKKIDTAIFPGIQGGPLMHAIAAKAVSFHEALQPSFHEYIANVIKNARYFAGVMHEKGWRIVSGGTDNHLFLVDLRSKLPDVTGHDAANWLNAAQIVCNKNAIPNDPRPPIKTSGLRIGTPAITTRGLGKDEINVLADLMDTVLMSNGDTAVINRTAAKIHDLCKRFPLPNDKL